MKTISRDELISRLREYPALIYSGETGDYETVLPSEAVRIADALVKDFQIFPKRQPEKPPMVKKDQIWRRRSTGAKVRVQHAGYRVDWIRVTPEKGKQLLGSCYNNTFYDKYDYYAEDNA